MEKKQIVESIIELTEKVSSHEQALRAVPEIFNRLNTISENLAKTCGKIENLDRLYGNGWREALEKRFEKRIIALEDGLKELKDQVTRLEDVLQEVVRRGDFERNARKGGFVGFLELSWDMFKRRAAAVIPWLIIAFLLWISMKVKLFGESIKFFGN